MAGAAATLGITAAGAASDCTADENAIDVLDAIVATAVEVNIAVPITKVAVWNAGRSTDQAVAIAPATLGIVAVDTCAAVRDTGRHRRFAGVS